MLSRRTVLGGLAMEGWGRRPAGAPGSGRYGGLPPPRLDQQYKPAGAPVPVGAAAGIFRGRLVVISSSGPAQGLFIYSGTPGLGNPPILSEVAHGVTQDPFGNTISGIIQVGQAPSQIVLDTTASFTIIRL